MDLLDIENSTIKLNSNLDEYAFGKTTLGSIANQEGIYFDGRNFKIWTFDEVKSFDVDGSSERLVFYCGKNPLSDNASTLDSLIEQGGEKSLLAVQIVCKAITSAAQDGIELPEIGAGGILVDIESDGVLFLPKELFVNALNKFPPEKSFALNHSWLNTTLTALPSICFERAVIVYKFLTGKFPFTSHNAIERNADILDRKFLPLKMCVKGIDDSLADEVDKALRLNSDAVAVPGKKQKGKSSEDLIPNKNFPVDSLEAAWELSKKNKAHPDKDFSQAAEDYMKKMSSKVSTKRNIRRNAAGITFTAAAIIAVFIIIFSIAKSKADDYTSKGLTSTQTIVAFFKGVNEKNIELLSNIEKGRTADHYVDTVSRIYVMHKQRQVYKRDNGFAKPEMWLLYSTNLQKWNNSGLYGITNLKIDGENYELEVPIKKKNENPEPVTEEGNIALTDKSRSVHNVEYYLLVTGSEDVEFEVRQMKDTFTLTYKKDKWIITDIKSEETQVPVDCETFKNNYFALLDENDANVKKVLDIMRKSYSWLPTEYAVQKEIDNIQYRAAHPYDAL